MMNEHVYKKVEVVGSSTTSIDDAVRTAIARASSSIKNMRWFEVDQIRGEIEQDQVAHIQVTMRIGFTIED